MPRRPPKKWFYHCVERVKEEAPEVTDPEALCAWVWYHHAKPTTKKKILKEESSNPDEAIRLLNLAKAAIAQERCADAERLITRAVEILKKEEEVEEA
jgi:Flp pilus assembly protein TadD